jgi:hypothetical protein
MSSALDWPTAVVVGVYWHVGDDKPTLRKGSQRLHIGSAVQQACVLSFGHECWLRIGATKRSHEHVGSYKELAEDDGRR